MSAAAGSLRAHGFSGVVWMFATHSAVLVSQLGTIAVLSRLLSAYELGLVTLTIAMMNLALLSGGLGLARGLVQMRAPGPEHEASALVGCLASGLGAWVICALAAPGIATFFDAPELRGPFVVGGAAFAVVAAAQVPLARLERALRFRSIGLAQTLGFAIPSALITVVAAWLGAGIWCAVWGMLGGRALQTAWLAAAAGRPPRPDLAALAPLRELARFGLFTTGAATIAFALANVDYAIVGRMLGPAALGLYTIAYQLATVPRSRIGQALAAVMFPAFAKLQDDPARLNRSYITLNRYVAYVVFPALAVLFVLAEPIVAVAFGERWLPAVPAIRVLCPAGALMAVRSTAGPALNALGRPDLGMYTNAAMLAVSVPLLVRLVPGGVLHAAVAVLLISIIDFLPLQLVLRRLTGLSVGRLLSALLAPTALALALGLVLGGALHVVIPAATSAALTLTLGTVAAAGLYLLLIAAFARTFMHEMLAMAAAARGGR